MLNLLVLGTDTDAGKTTFALLWLARFADRCHYWKPIETGPSDSEQVARLVPGATVHPPYQRFAEPVAPPLAARRAGKVVACAADIARSRPALSTAADLLIESFGSPFSPLNETETQLALLAELNATTVLVCSSVLGAVGRSLQGLAALRAEGIEPSAVVLLGPRDEYAVEAIQRHSPDLAVIALVPPRAWSAEGVRQAAQEQAPALEGLQTCLEIACHAGDVSAADMLRRDGLHVWHPYTSLRDPDPPLPIVAAHDEYLTLADGRTIIDGISSWWTILHGHRHPPLMQELRSASRRVDHVLFAGGTHPWGVTLAELLLESLGWDGGRVFYSDNGSTAVEVALKMAYQFWCHRGEPGRTRFVGFEHAYHGDTFGAMAVSRDPVFFGRFEPLLLGADMLPLDPDRLDEHLQARRGQIAAVILEPLVQGAGGMRMHAPETLRRIVEIAHRHDVLFIADEVMTGMGRTGTLWAHRAADVRPDLVCAAKTLAGGILPLAATLAVPHVVAAWNTDDRTRTFFHGHSFTAHPLACAIAVRNLRLLTPESLHAPGRMAAFWTEALAPLRAHPRVKDVRVCGSIGAVELDVPGGYLADVGRLLRAECVRRGVLLRPLGAVLYALPPLGTAPASLERIAEAMTAAVNSLG